jgi:hypothetical protein
MNLSRRQRLRVTMGAMTLLVGSLILLAGAVIGFVSGPATQLLPYVSGAVGLVGVPLSLRYFALLRSSPTEDSDGSAPR